MRTAAPMITSVEIAHSDTGEMGFVISYIEEAEVTQDVQMIRTVNFRSGAHPALQDDSHLVIDTLTRLIDLATQVMRSASTPTSIPSKRVREEEDV